MVNYLCPGMVYILQHSTVQLQLWAGSWSKVLRFLWVHTQGSKEATDFFFNWLLTVIGTGCLVFERVQFSLRGYQLYTRIEWHIFWYTPYFVRLNESFWNYLTASREIQWVLNQRRSSMSDSTLDDIIFLKSHFERQKSIQNDNDNIPYLLPSWQNTLFSFFVRFSTKKGLWFFVFRKIWISGKNAKPTHYTQVPKQVRSYYSLRHRNLSTIQFFRKTKNLRPFFVEKRTKNKKSISI